MKHRENPRDYSDKQLAEAIQSLEISLNHGREWMSPKSLRQCERFYNACVKESHCLYRILRRKP